MYLYDHSAYIYLIDPEGKLAKAINSEGGKQTITETLSALMPHGDSDSPR